MFYTVRKKENYNTQTIMNQTAVNKQTLQTDTKSHQQQNVTIMVW